MIRNVFPQRLALLFVVACGSAEATDGNDTASAAPPLSPPSSAPRACAERCSSLERCTDGRCQPACPKGEVFVPATPKEGFVMGSGVNGGRVDPKHHVVLTKPFCMDATEVTVKAYRACVKAGVCEEPRTWGLWRNYEEGREDHPLNKVNWKQAKTYCEHEHKSLPTEAQWEWAATGGDGRRWAWGNEQPDCTRTDFAPDKLRRPSSDDGCHGGGTSPVGSFPLGDKIWPNGRIHDLSGNVWEWCLDNYAPWSGKDEVDPLHLTMPEGTHVVRGGGWNRSSRGIRVDYRGGAVVEYQVPGLGFRCVRNPS